jgi:hypothetical protein
MKLGVDDYWINGVSKVGNSDISRMAENQLISNLTKI